MKIRRYYIYTRVSTSMQVDGYSLDAQKDKLKKYAEFQDMIVAGEYFDEGKSGKNIEGRPQFLQMLKDIILVQTMEGRRQKAREGKWNGGFAPYGYKLENGELLIAEDEAEVIRISYDKYVNTTMGRDLR